MEPSTPDRRSFLKLLGVAAGASLAVPGVAGATQGSGDWRMFAGGPRATRYLGEVSGPSENLTEAWSVDVGQRASEPVVVDGTLYVGGDGLTAVTPEGEVAWETTEVDASLPPSYHDGRVLACGLTSVASLDAEGGSVEWTYERERYVWPRPRGDAVYVTEVDPELAGGSVAALDPADGTVRWEATTPPLAWDAVAVDDSHLYVPTISQEGGARTLTAFSVEDGSVAWEVDLSLPPDAIVSQPAVGSEYLYLVADGELLGVDPASGETAFSSTYESASPLPFVAAAPDEVYVPTQDGRLLAHDAATGDPAWSSEETGWAQNLAVTSEVVYSSRQGMVGAYARGDREPISSVEPGTATFTPIPTADALYVATTDGSVLAVREGVASGDGEGESSDGEAAGDDEEGADSSEETSDGNETTGDSGNESVDADESADEETSESDSAEGSGDEATENASDERTEEDESDDGGSADSVPGFGAVATLAGVGSVARWLAGRSETADRS